jgi:microcystin-dependent protein
MTQPYVGEVRIFGFPRIPTGWFACNGSLKSIAEYSTLFTLIGTAYGGDGVSTFAVPDLRGQLPLHWGRGPGLSPRTIGEAAGTENVTLLLSNIPTHNHNFMVTKAAATTVTPGNTVTLGALPSDGLYENGVTRSSTSADLMTGLLTQSGESIGHENTMPTLTLSICIAWAGIFPSRN